MNIREMVEEDYDQVYQLWLSCAGMGLNDLDDSKEGIARFLQRNPQTCLVAVENQTIIGAILVGSDGRRASIYHTAVHPNYRRRGIARQLVETVLTVLDDLKIHKVALVVFKRNTEGNQFWERLGFSVREDLIYRNQARTEMTRIDT
ncbi:acetyltransferase, GNAT family [Streptococcus anginosus F0211]|uniref:Acetyltransferase, GNAT family n=1 Tax=Streptococcus anginosus F0211 TaxID=706437 RepID=E6J1P3_STRAP|nr:GNAT family N-acetyltransferase [Streptococcus anginosus]EFU22272.1 acetyltransferase, GNAT family [Streptococcus anginosus F0211]MDX5006322.1 GNAT family N-acetyltransferase [Streptococcus anginosus]MDX5054589.1 GNAT family N-acetyltransferase [Streptococcus anginosus]MDX5056403.1 GNAT family N-acetyltransferase [Streptococcus anginosus]MDX5058337.1 GNAT family N-acetyltransferase [Streptococcus anginosus]